MTMMAYQCHHKKKHSKETRFAIDGRTYTFQEKVKTYSLDPTIYEQWPEWQRATRNDDIMIYRDKEEVTIPRYGDILGHKKRAQIQGAPEGEPSDQLKCEDIPSSVLMCLGILTSKTSENIDKQEINEICQDEIPNTMGTQKV